MNRQDGGQIVKCRHYSPSYLPELIALLIKKDLELLNEDKYITTPNKSQVDQWLRFSFQSRDSVNANNFQTHLDFLDLFTLHYDKSAHRDIMDIIG